uniref:Uncharacterized protein n=1 Tax=Arundo donax TaxID=35708 RepID=A0A0A9ATC5_ARUDO
MQTNRQTSCSELGTWLLRLGWGPGRAGEEDAGAGALALGAGWGKEHRAHASRRRRRRVALLWLLKRGPRRRAQTKMGVAAAATGLGTGALARGPRRRSGQLTLPLQREQLLLLEEMELSGLHLALRDQVREGMVIHAGRELGGRRRRLPCWCHETIVAVEAQGVARYRDAVGHRLHARDLAGGLVEDLPRVGRLLLQRRRRRRVPLGRPTVRAILARHRQPAQRRLRRPNRHLRLGRRLPLAVLQEKPRETARQPVQAVLLVTLAPRGHRRLLLLGEKVVIKELFRQQELFAAVRPLRRHFLHLSKRSKKPPPRPQTS